MGVARQLASRLQLVTFPPCDSLLVILIFFVTNVAFVPRVANIRQETEAWNMPAHVIKRLESRRVSCKLVFALASDELSEETHAIEKDEFKVLCDIVRLYVYTYIYRYVY